MGSSDSRLLVESLLRRTNWALVHGNPGLAVAGTLAAHSPDAVLVEMDASGTAGLEAVCRIRQDPLNSELVVVGVGIVDDHALPKVALMAGCSGFFPYPLDPVSFPSRLEAVLSGEREILEEEEVPRIQRHFSEALIEELGGRLAIFENRTFALTEERERQRHLTLQVLTSMATLLDAKDSYTLGHSRRVTASALHLGQRLGLSAGDLRTLERAALLHDIGKIALDLSQIHRPGPLSPEERAKVREHSETGYHILMSLDYLQDEALVVRHHHRRFSDYAASSFIPRRIRLLASILALADSFDAMTTQRSYNRPRSVADAKVELARCAGSQFDPALVEVFIQSLGEGEGTR